MYLQKLEIQGFKSFAPKTTLFFPTGNSHVKSIAAVVGPNGSGKSNIADAIRWVLGEQSMKLLRSKKSEDVIFSGSEKKAQLGFCEVSLYFNNEDKAFPLDFSEVVITRRLYRNGESEYCINKNKVKLSEINLLLAQAHFGQKSYNVIGQGMVESIINAPPSERKEFFDEAAGVKQYQIKKESALSRLKTTKEHITQAQLLLAELEPKIRFFQRQIKRLEERDSFEKHLIELLKQYYESVWNSLSKKRKEHHDALEHIQRNIADAVGYYEETKNLFEQLEKKSEDDVSSPFSSQQKEYDVLSRKKNDFLSRHSLIEGRLTGEYERSGEQQAQWLSIKKRETVDRIANLREESDIFKKDIALLEKEEEHLSAQLVTCEEELRSAETKFIDISSVHQSVSVETIHEELKRISALAHEEKTDIFTIDGFKAFIKSISDKVEYLVKKIEDSLMKGQQESIHLVRSQIDGCSEKKRELLAKIQSVRVQLGVKRGSLLRQEDDVKKMESDIEIIDKDSAYFSSGSADTKKKALQQEKQDIEDQLRSLEGRLTSLKELLSTRYGQERESNRKLLDLQKEMALRQRVVEGLREQTTAFQLELAKIDTHQEELLLKIFEDLKVDISQQNIIKEDRSALALLGFRKDQGEVDMDHTRSEIPKLRQKLEQIGTIDSEILKEYESTKERYEFLTTQINDLNKAIDSLLKAITELDEIIRRQFDTALRNINIKFDQYFRQLFNGGTARLIIQMEEKEEIEEDEKERDEIAGIEIQATPPGKKLKSISVLSGGEKALTAIALICAIVSNTTPPFIVLDEVDAALDESNAMKFATIIQELGEKTQCVIITHNRVTMHIASVVYGVTMGEDGISRVLSLDIGKIDDILQKY